MFDFLGAGAVTFSVVTVHKINATERNAILLANLNSVISNNANKSNDEMKQVISQVTSALNDVECNLDVDYCPSLH